MPDKTCRDLNLGPLNPQSHEKEMFAVSATGLYGIFVIATQMTDYDPSLTLSWLQDLCLA